MPIINLKQAGIIGILLHHRYINNFLFLSYNALQILHIYSPFFDKARLQSYSRQIWVQLLHLALIKPIKIYSKGLQWVNYETWYHVIFILTKLALQEAFHQNSNRKWKNMVICHIFDPNIGCIWLTGLVIYTFVCCFNFVMKYLLTKLAILQPREKLLPIADLLELLYANNGVVGSKPLS